MMASQSNVAIVILAAGASKRMGAPKQLLKWGDTTLINHTINTAVAANAKEIILVLGAHFELIEKEIKNHVTLLNNVAWEKGLGTSIAFAIAHLHHSKRPIDGVLIMLCDQPLITADFLKSIKSKFQAHKKQIIATSYGHGRLGVPALFDQVYFEDLMALSDDQGAQKLLRTYQSCVLSLTPPTENWDLDTKLEYTNLYQSHFKK